MEMSRREERCKEGWSADIIDNECIERGIVGNAKLDQQWLLF